MKKVIIVIVLVIVIVPLLWLLQHTAFPQLQVSTINSWILSPGMSEDAVEWLLGGRGMWVESPRVPDANAPSGNRPIVTGDKILQFIVTNEFGTPVNQSPSLFVGFVDGKLVDKAWHLRE